MLASYSAAELTAINSGVVISFDKPDTKQVETTFPFHTSAQCRLDTYMSGSLCDRPYDTTTIPRQETDLAASSCHPYNGETIGVRPRCWFAPKLSTFWSRPKISFFGLTFFHNYGRKTETQPISWQSNFGRKNMSFGKYFTKLLSHSTLTIAVLSSTSYGAPTHNKEVRLFYY